ncbi:MAG: hypothetical protein ACXWDJ_10565 [Aeromicrobium sp.]
MADEKPAKADDKVTVFMRAGLRGHRAGQRRQVDKDTAERLVRDGHAKFPKGK